MKKALVLLSGGMDSTTCLALAIKEFGVKNVCALSIFYGQKNAKNEMEAAARIRNYYGVDGKQIDLETVFECSTSALLVHTPHQIPKKSYFEQLRESQMKPIATNVPFRNGVFLSAAASIALAEGYSYLYYGTHADEEVGNVYPDDSIDFYYYIRNAILVGTRGQVQLIDPFIEKTKVDIIETGLPLKVPYELTWSCYESGSKPCGKCGKCLEQKMAFSAQRYGMMKAERSS